jgi:hypothetical protein
MTERLYNQELVERRLETPFGLMRYLEVLDLCVFGAHVGPVGGLLLPHGLAQLGTSEPQSVVGRLQAGDLFLANMYRALA